MARAQCDRPAPQDIKDDGGECIAANLIDVGPSQVSLAFFPSGRRQSRGRQTCAATKLGAHNGQVALAGQSDRRVAQQDSAERSRNKLTRTYAMQVAVLKRSRSGGEQKVTVQHVSVGEGGLALLHVRYEALSHVLFCVITPKRGAASDSCPGYGLVVVSAAEPDQRGRLRRRHDRRRLFCSRCQGRCIPPPWRSLRGEPLCHRDKYRRCGNANTAVASASIWKIKRFDCIIII